MKNKLQTFPPTIVFFMVALSLLTGTNSVQAQWVTHGPGSLTSVRSLAVLDTNIFAGIHAGGVFRSTNNGTSWTATGAGPTSVHALAISGTTLYAGSFGGGVFYSNDNGTGWTRDTVGLTNTSVNALAAAGSVLFAGTASGAFVTDLSGTWAPDTNGMSNPQVLSFAPDGSNLFAGTGGSFGGVYVSNFGPAWALSNNGLPNVAVFSLASSGSTLFAGTNGQGIFRSLNSGTNWEPDTNGMNLNGFPYLHVYALAFSGSNIFAGTSALLPSTAGAGIFLSTNNGTSWSPVNTGMPYQNVYALVISGSMIFAGTDAGVYQRPLSDMITSVNPLTSQLPHEFALQQNYPNPFNPATTISFDLPFKSFVSLKVLDVLGREISTLNSEELAAGTYSREFNAGSLSSGVYFYRLVARTSSPGHAGSFSETKKLLLVR